MNPDQTAAKGSFVFDSLCKSQQFQICHDGSSWVEPGLSKD